jgi:competence protein ComEC
VNGRLGELKWEVLWPRSPLRGVLPGNDASVTLRFTGAGDCAAGCLSSIFLGDLGREPQALLMAANSLGGTDVVKVAHHGSSDQNPRLYANLDATIGLIGVGADNGYGHPTDSLLHVLADQGTLAVRTDIQGMALLSPRPDGTVSVWTEHPLR